MAVMCAWASIGENGKITGGKPGDQTGREVKCGAIYDFGQTRVYRCKDRDKALAIGAAAHAMAINNMFGYNQSNRTTSFTELKKVKWVVADVKTPCNIDCSEMGACAVNVAYKYSKLQNCKQELERTKSFWTDLLSRVQVYTPMESINILLNFN